MKTFWSMAATGALVAASLTAAAPPAQAATGTAPLSLLVAAKKAPAPSIALGKKKTTVTKAPNKSIQKVVLPVLKLSTAKNRTAFTRYASAAVNAELKSFNGIRKGSCKGKQSASFSAFPTFRSVYKGRYASVTFRFTAIHCGAATANYNVRSFTLDLKTGKAVGIGRFVSQDDRTTKVAVATNFAVDKKSCANPIDPFTKDKRATGYLPRAKAWNVSSSGLRLHYGKYTIAAGYCGNPTVLLPWTEVATAKSMSGTVKNRIYTYKIKYNAKYKFYEGGVFYVATQGRKLTMFFGPVAPSHGNCLYGIRTGKSATMSPGRGEYEQPLAKVRYKFTDTTSNPKVNPASLAKGWKPASSTDLKVIKKVMGKIPTARSFCR